MSLSKKQLQNLKQSMKRRERRPEPTYVAPARLTLSSRERDRVTRSSAHLLLKIETTILETWKQFPQIDDEHVRRALIAVIRRQNESDDHSVQSLVENLQTLSERIYGDEELDEDWSLALRAILQSVDTHSTGEGSRHYLRFTEDFVGNMEAETKRKSLLP